MLVNPVLLDNLRSGMWGNPYGLAPSSAFAITDKFLYVSRIVPVRAMTISTGVVLVTVVAGQDDACDVGLYSATGTRLASSGATSGKLNGLGKRVFTLSASVTLQPRTVYYSAFVAAKGAGAAATVAANAVQGGQYDAWQTGADSITFDVGSLELGVAVLGSVLLPASLPALAGSGGAVAVAWREF